MGLRDKEIGIILDTVLARVSEFIRAEGLIGAGARVLVGFSGGADSTCLLHGLVRLGFDCTAAYLHHGQRAEADREVEACRDFAAGLGIPFVSGNADVPKMAAELGVGLEEAGRAARYGFFEEASRQTGCDLIATAHTLDDHLETVLLNLARGTGMTGLRGIPVRRDSIVRPILCLSKAETEEYCSEHGLGTIHDPANDDLQFSRARVRHRIVPELMKINPATPKAVLRMSKLVAEEDDFLNGMAAAALEQSELVKNPELAFLTQDCELILDRSKITSLPAVLFKRSMMLASKALGSPLDSKHVLAILQGVSHEEKGSVTSPEGLVTVEWNEKAISLHGQDTTEPFRDLLQYPGTVESPAMGWKMTALVESGPSVPAARRSLRANIPLDTVRRPLFFRSLLAGERIQPVGFEGRRKVSDLMAEAGLSEIGRRRLPIVCDLVGALWIPGICLSQRAVSVTESSVSGSEMALTLYFEALARFQP